MLPAVAALASVAAATWSLAVAARRVDAANRRTASDATDLLRPPSQALSQAVDRLARDVDDHLRR